MLKIITLLAMCALSTGFKVAPTAALRKGTSLRVVETPNPELNSFTGAFIETGGRVWDPWGLSNWVPPSWAREAELANGRSAMLATVGWVWPKWFGAFPGFDDVTTTDPIGALTQADPQWWAQFILFCGVIEFNKYRAGQNGKNYLGETDGEPFYDPAGIFGRTPEAREKMAERELKNARLAMLGIASFAAGHFIPGSVPCLPPGF
ncbi:hypothetical protein TrST_g5588 [Triparma strigata]|uniref:Chlorophyll a-b binding protein, chloroplastic n=1 Tax=Triparma strigata TaxID=1606541 RepID=A0A9W7B0A2_9STRA|nr:hypothetical protein TrST_g5588 [Triparma strigata]